VCDVVVKRNKSMNTLNEHIREYQLQLSKGHIQKAYKGIMTFMSSLKSQLEKAHPDYFTSALYFGYMDMTYFAFTPPDLKEKKVKGCYCIFTRRRKIRSLVRWK